MPLLRGAEAQVVDAIGALVDCNPFHADRVELEKRALGPAFVHGGPLWHAAGDAWVANPNTPLLRECAESLAAELHGRLQDGAAASAAETSAYREMVLYLLWLRYEDALYELIPPDETGCSTPDAPVDWFADFARDANFLLAPLPGPPPDGAHLFALAFQARRAFDFIFRRIFGGSLPAAQLRATVWESIFTCDMRAYRSDDYRNMRDVPTLITGEPGTGKELVAGAIGMSQYIPFDAARRAFADASQAQYFAVNPSALTPTLIESELFGHERGAFTGADAAHQGWFEACGPYGAVFLDEVGELAPALQVKLLRVLQNRTFQRVGETRTRRFEGKLLAATNRNLPEEIAAGRFRDDLYYRIKADRITTPTLRAQLADAPDDLGNLILVLAKRIVGERRAPSLAERAENFVRHQLGADYEWPGNMRELERCVQAIRIRGRYEADTTVADEAAELALRIRRGDLKAKELTRLYVQLVHERHGNIRETARRTGLDRKTVANLLDGEDGGEGDPA